MHKALCKLTGRKAVILSSLNSVYAKFSLFIAAELVVMFIAMS